MVAGKAGALREARGWPRRLGRIAVGRLAAFSMMSRRGERPRTTPALQASLRSRWLWSVRASRRSLSEQRMPANSVGAIGLAPEVHNRINKRSKLMQLATALVAAARGWRRQGQLTSPAH